MISCAAKGGSRRIALGQKKIPAIVIQASEDDCFVMSLVENIARRQHSPLELIKRPVRSRNVAIRRRIG